MAQSDTSKELKEHLFVRIIIPLQDELSFVIVELVGVDKLIRQVLKREVIIVGFVSRLVCTVIVTVRIARLFGHLLIILKVADLIFEKVPADVKNLDTLFVVSLNSYS